MFGCLLSGASLSTVEAGNRQSTNVQYLYEMCKDKRNSLSQGMCIGYVSGIASSMFWNSFILKDLTDEKAKLEIGLVSACAKSFVSNAAMVPAFIKWAEDHPAEWGKDMQVGVMAAIINTWPCDRTGNAR